MADEAHQPTSVMFNAISPPRDPPPESSDNVFTRRWVIIAFWAVAIVLGVPTWWKTTTVYRADLPLQLMTDWAEGKVCTPSWPLLVHLDTSSLAPKHADEVLSATRNAYNHVDRLGQNPKLDMVFTSDREGPRQSGNISRQSHQSAMTVKFSALKGSFWSSKGSSQPSASILPHDSILQVSYGKSLESDIDFAFYLAMCIVENLRNTFAEEEAILSRMTDLSNPVESSNLLSLEVAESVSRRETRAFKYAPTYHLTFSLFTSEARPYSWEIDQALEETFTPLLSALSAVSNFTIETQVQPFATLSPSLRPVYNEKLSAWTIPREELGSFVNAAEWPLSPSIGQGPTIHFVLYVASASQTPLLVESENRNSWLVPQWGGITIHNPNIAPGQRNPALLTSFDLQPALIKFSNHLLTLLGVPLTPSKSLKLRLAALTRVRSGSVFLAAASTLGSLARVVSGLPSISIPDSVAHNVSSTLQHLNAACNDFKNGNFAAALSHAREADAHAEKAFFEKSMVGQAYFPDEHKVAVYLPLLGPVAVPLLVSALREIKPLTQRFRSRQQ